MGRKDWYWLKSVMENVPHGEEGHLQLNFKDACTVANILLNRGFAVLLTGGDVGEDVALRWLYAGNTDQLDWADYESVVFTSADYLADYPEAYYSDSDSTDEG